MVALLSLDQGMVSKVNEKAMRRAVTGFSFRFPFQKLVLRVTENRKGYFGNVACYKGKVPSTQTSDLESVSRGVEASRWRNGVMRR